MKIVHDALVLIGRYMHVEIFSRYFYIRLVRNRPGCKIETFIIPCINCRFPAPIIQCLFQGNHPAAVFRDHSPMITVLWAEKQHNPGAILSKCEETFLYKGTSPYGVWNAPVNMFIYFRSKKYVNF